MKIEDVYSVEDLNVWSLTSGKSTAIVHMQLIPGSSSKWEEVQSKAKHLLLNTFGMYKCTIQLQSYRQEVNRTCANCQSASTWFCVLGVYSLIYPAVTGLRAINANVQSSWQLCPCQAPISQKNSHSSLTDICMIFRQSSKVLFTEWAVTLQIPHRRQSKTILHPFDRVHKMYRKTQNSVFASKTTFFQAFYKDVSASKLSVELFQIFVSV